MNATPEDLAQMAHRLRTPLTAIMGFADLLEGAEDRETILEYVRIIRDNADRLNDLLKELLEP
ncbi:MAG TPA: histidine kinase dimerization/phospho-acceptor domain-containing protein [Candidatus Dormibacteraeota bacterium]|nr:histidine kinase dimerization/phospho-acceptor domain-containing protein [Candidatus Dormibacteraeota bacterium]